MDRYWNESDTLTLFKALGLNGQKLLGVPVIVQPSQAEKNRIAGSYADLMSRGSKDKVRKKKKRLSVMLLSMQIIRYYGSQFCPAK